MTWTAGMKIEDQCVDCEIVKNCPVKQLVNQLGNLATGIEYCTDFPSQGKIEAECYAKRPKAEHPPKIIDHPQA